MRKRNRKLFDQLLVQFKANDFDGMLKTASLLDPNDMADHQKMAVLEMIRKVRGEKTSKTEGVQDAKPHP